MEILNGIKEQLETQAFQSRHNVSRRVASGWGGVVGRRRRVGSGGRILTFILSRKVTPDKIWRCLRQPLHLVLFAGSCLAYSTTYRPHIFLRCAVFLVSAVLYPRTIRHACSCATARAVTLTANTVNALHQMLQDSVHIHPGIANAAQAGSARAKGKMLKKSSGRTWLADVRSKTKQSENHARMGPSQRRTCERRTACSRHSLAPAPPRADLRLGLHVSDVLSWTV